jgi:uncharacterized protein
MRLRSQLSAQVLLIAIFAALASAEPIAELHASNYINDFAGVLSEPTTNRLNDVCRQIDEKAGAQIAVVTINSLDGSDIESYANTLFRKWGVGEKSSKKGVLILLAVKDHRYRTEVGYGLEPILPDGKVGGFGREAVPSLRGGDYNAAVSLMVMRVAIVIAQDAGVQLSNATVPVGPVNTETPDSGTDWGSIIFIVLFGGMGLLYVLYRGSQSNNRRGGRGGWGGGGFWGSGSGGFFGDSGSSGGGFSWGGGGFGEGGGFGGFGGGDSGGGGASGSW